MSVLDGITMDAAEITNEIYFDVILNSKWKVKSSSLPEQTLITQPKTEREIQTDYDNYINQMIHSVRKWNMSEFVSGKTYEKDGVLYNAIIENHNNTFSINFYSTDKVAHNSTRKDKPQNKKSWWKF